MITDVQIKKLNVHPDERGRVIEILRQDDDFYQNFGQVYLTTTYPQVVKAWHLHKIQTDYICCIQGMIKLVLYDGRLNSPTLGEVNEFFIGEHNPVLVQVPKEIYHGWKCISDKEALIINVPTHPYNPQKPDEYRLPYNTELIPYDWKIKMG
ncbi:MAG: dTDP-4-dehydrorhamnose 3,5-epimerase family protein [Patescibacteria group bacterium]|nr:dTDP-4-dehydrorhamnose 3,5-epimerase family protein [Patescibacteria group bacterium]